MSGDQTQAKLPLAYIPLDAPREQIRLLHLLPGSWEDAISCTTSTAYISDNPVCESLSYAWGDPLITRTVFLNGHAVGVTVNLFAALRRLRYRASSRCLWVDALCINQADLEEKAHQVSLMGKIYFGATRGLMWLGEYSEQLSDCSDLATSNGGLLPNSVPEANVVEAFDWLRRLADNTGPKSKRSSIDYELTRRSETSSCVSSLQMLLALPWWSRMWTLQEVVLPHAVSFVCGSSEITLAEMDRAQDNYSEHQMAISPYSVYGSANPALDRLSVQVVVMAQLREAGEDGRDIVHALFSCKNRQATDPRDKVYAVLGLFPRIAQRMQVDYGKDTSEISTELLLCLIRMDGDLKALACVARTPKDPSLPSWVPNWCYMHEDNMPGGEVGLINEYDEGYAAKDTTAQLHTPCRGILSILGLSVDKVVSFQAVQATSSPAPSKVLAEFFRGWINSLQIGPPQVTDAYIGIIAHLIDRMRNLFHHHATVFITDQGHIGYACYKMEFNDTVHILFGGNLPFILRASRRPQDQLRNPYYTLVCSCYVHGIMDGEALQWGLKPEWVSLV